MCCEGRGARLHMCVPCETTEQETRKRKRSWGLHRSLWHATSGPPRLRRRYVYVIIYVYRFNIILHTYIWTRDVSISHWDWLAYLSISFISLCDHLSVQLISCRLIKTCNLIFIDLTNLLQYLSLPDMGLLRRVLKPQLRQLSQASCAYTISQPFPSDAACFVSIFRLLLGNYAFHTCTQKHHRLHRFS